MRMLHLCQSDSHRISYTLTEDLDRSVLQRHGLHQSIPVQGQATLKESAVVHDFPSTDTPAQPFLYHWEQLKEKNVKHTNKTLRRMLKQCTTIQIPKLLLQKVKPVIKAISLD